MKLFFASIVATLSGFIALSYEILWVRVYNFVTEGRPPAFGLLIGAYLAGLAVGAYVAGRYCDRSNSERPKHLYLVGVSFVVANIAGFLCVPVVAILVANGVPVPWTLPVVGLVAATLGLGFPLLSHFAIPADQRAGARLSYIYLGNILGSTFGSLITGLWLLEVFSLRDVGLVLSIVGVSIGALLMLVHSVTLRSRAWVGVGLVLVLVSLVRSSPGLYDGIYEKLFYKADYYPGLYFAHTAEGRSGVVNMTYEGIVYGNGSYDGIMNVNPLPGKDKNRVLRAYAVSAFHPRPREILFIGLGSGSWVQVLANSPDVDRIIVVEINPGFVEMMRRTPVVASVLENPKVKILIDDGRRYLGRTPEKFDLIIQNTIVYWRSHASTLLSREYLELSRRHLKPGGIIYYNTTMNTAAQKTGATIFPYAIRFQNMLIVGGSPITIDRDRFHRRLQQWKIDGHPILPPHVRASGLALLREQDWRGGPTWEDRASILGRTKDDPIITDDNMATEWWAWKTYPE